MKTYFRIIILALLPVAFFSCNDKIEETYTVNEPIYMSYEVLRGDLKVADGQDIIQPGKIYFKDQYIFVNEYQKGIHVIDNQNPAAPVIKKFIEIPGSVDMAIKDNILYADSYVDLVAIDVSNLEDIHEVSRVENAFPYMVPACEDGAIEQVDNTKGVITGWRTTERKVNIDNIEDRYTYYPVYTKDLLFAAEYNGMADGGSKSGTGGSMARFTVYDDYLYAVDNYQLRLFNISESANPVAEGQFYVGWNIETLFPYEGKLFMGSTTGMYIYSLANPANPEYISAFWHASSCDPVVVEGHYAYVTLRAGNLCGDNESLLSVIDITDLLNPVLVEEYPMEEPYGLGIDNSILFICDGDAGLKVYDATDPLVIDQHKVAQYADINAWDVIPLSGVLIMIGTDGLYQYDYTDLTDIKALSVIPIEHLQHQE